MRKIKCIYLYFALNLDTQMVAHILGPSEVGAMDAEVSYYTAKETSSHPSCGTAWDVLLYYNRLAELAPRAN